MTGIEAEMTVTEATQVTARIKLLISSITESTEKVISLIERAEAGRAWSALGYASWTAYVATEFNDALSGLARAERMPIVAKLSDTGMSTRAVAAVTGVSVGTVVSDVATAGVQSLNTSPTKTTTGLDGKTYVRNGKPTADGMQDLANDVPPVKPRPRRRPLPDAYWRAVVDLDKAVRKLEKLHADDRFAGHRDVLNDGHRRLLDEIGSVVAGMVDDLAGWHQCHACGERMLPSRQCDVECEGCRG